MADELSAPLVRRRDRVAAKRAAALSFGGRQLPVARLAMVGIAVVLVGVGLRVMLVDDPGGGRPTAEVPINSTHNGNAIAGQVVPAPAAAAPASIVAEPETSIPLAGGPSITTLGSETATGESPSSTTTDGSGLIPALIESTDDGPVPRIGDDGTTPFDAYARQAPDTAGKARIAIVVTGLGLSETGTLDAIGRLPDDVTLAFAPYGKTLSRTVAAARAEGHELLLEVPLEPFDYPDNDPGPDTLLTGQPPRANLDKLLWLMARFGGYVGMINHMGARFTASGADFGPVMEELGSRGLGYVDDGSSNRSIAAQLATKDNVPYARATMQLDDNPAKEPILEALAALEKEAKANGSALGVISALPVSIGTVVEWAKGLADRGIVLVPASALMKAKA